MQGCWSTVGLFFCHSLVSVWKRVKICDFKLSMLYKCTHIYKHSAYICFHTFYSTLCFSESHKLNFYGFVMCVYVWGMEEGKQKSKCFLVMVQSKTHPLKYILHVKKKGGASIIWSWPLYWLSWTTFPAVDALVNPEF